MLSEKKAINSLKPWWEIAYNYGLIALCLLGKLKCSILFMKQEILTEFIALAMLLVTSGFGQGSGFQKLSIINEVGSAPNAGEVVFKNDSSAEDVTTRRSENVEEIDVVLDGRGSPTFIISGG